jgi:hypothetical protein
MGDPTAQILRRRAAGGDGAQQQCRAVGSSAQGRSHATVHDLACGLYQSDKRGMGKPREQRGSTKRRGGDVHRGGAATSGGASTASRSRRVRAQEHLQVAPVAPLPSDGGAEAAARRREATEAQVNGGGGNGWRRR